METNKERASLNLQDDFDVSDFKPIKKKHEGETIIQEKIEQVALDSGFVSRKNRTLRRKKQASPYSNQMNFKCRNEIKILFKDLSYYLDCYDHSTLEMALLALLEKKKLNDLIIEFHKVTDGIYEF